MYDFCNTYQLHQFQYSRHGFEILVVDFHPSEQVTGIYIFYAGFSGFGLRVLDGDHGFGHGFQSFSHKKLKKNESKYYDVYKLVFDTRPAAIDLTNITIIIILLYNSG